MRTLARTLGYLVLFGLLACLLPFILVLAVYDWLLVGLGKRRPEYFIPEHPDSQRAWIETMERGRQIQRKEEHQ